MSETCWALCGSKSVATCKPICWLMSSPPSWIPANRSWATKPIVRPMSISPTITSPKCPSRCGITTCCVWMSGYSPTLSIRMNRILTCAGTLPEPSKGKERTIAPRRTVRSRKAVSFSGVRSESVIGCKRQKLQQVLSNFCSSPRPSLAHILRHMRKECGGEGQQHLQHPGETEEQDKGNDENFGNEHEGLFLHLGNSLKDADNHPNHETSKQRGRGEEEGSV